MKQTIKIVTLLMLFFVGSTYGAWADTSTGINVNGSADSWSSAQGTVTVGAHEDACTHYKVVINVAPAPGYTTGLSLITAKKDGTPLTFAYGTDYNTSDASTDPSATRDITLYLSDGPDFTNDVDLTVEFVRADGGVSLESNISHTTVAFYDGGTDISAFNTQAPGDVAIGIASGHNVVMHIVPDEGYWTNEQLLFGMENTGSMARTRGPGIDTGNLVKAIGTPKANGDGWYYYMVPAGHNYSGGYKFSAIEGYVVPLFDLATATLDSEGKTLTATAGTDWTATIAVDEVGFTYNGAAQGPQLSGTAIQVKKGDNNACSLPASNVTLTGNSQTNAGNYNVSLSAAATGCFKGTKSDIPFTIAAKTPATVTIELAGVPSGGYVYDGTAKTPTVTVKDGNTTIPESEYTVTISNNTQAGTATVTVTDKDGGNYTVSGTTTFNIQKATVTITADAKTKVAGEDDPELTYTVSGLLGSDALTGALSRETGEDAGEYAITIGSLTAGSNYTITFVGAKLTIINPTDPTPDDPTPDDPTPDDPTPDDPTPDDPTPDDPTPDDPEDPTAINTIEDETSIDNWFDLTGRRIKKPQKAGLYIRNGKKVVVR